MRLNKFFRVFMGLAVLFGAIQLVLPMTLWSEEILLGRLSAGGSHWPIWVAKDQGYIKEQKLDLREFHTNSVSKALQALSANSTNLLYPSNSQGTIAAMAKGAQLKIIAGNVTKAMYELIVDPKYKKVEDLRGATMGVINLSSGSTVLLQKILGAHGLKFPGDYDMLTVGGTPQRYAAVKKGAVAAAMVTIPTSFQAEEDGLKILANINQYLPQYQFTVITGNAKWMEDHRDQTVRFLMAIIKGMRFLNDPKNKEAAIKSMLGHFKISRKYSEMAYKYMIEELKPIDNNAALVEEGLKTVIKLEVERKTLKEAYPPSKFIDDSYLKDALKRLGS